MPDRSDSAAKIDCLEGTITSIRPLRNGTAMQVTLNRRVRVVVPHGVSQFFAGLRVRITGAWCHGARRRYFVASAVEPLESYTDLGVERLSQLLLGIPQAVGDRLAVLELLAPALTWLVSSGFHSAARRLARYTIRRAHLVAHNPYSLIRRRELSFDAAEMLYRRLHGDSVALPRLQAGTTEVLREAERKGRARLTREELATLVTARLDLPTTVEVVWSEVWKASIVARDGDLYCLPSWCHQRRRAMQTLRNNQMTIESAGGGAAGPLLSHRYTVLTGSARSGKTSLVRELVSACRAAGWRVAVTAMTGKAASVIGSDAMTLHRLLGYGPGGYAKEALPYDLLVVDEASMLTWPVLCATLSVMRGHILFVGDVRQLPPVEGEGAFPELLRLLPVRDLGAVTSVEVTTVHHWSEEHLLMNLATMVRNCEMEKREWQVLSPIRHSRLGAVHLNQYLQRLTNGDGSPVGEGVWIGDRVMIIRNDYTGERAVYNGEMGYVQGRGSRGALVKMLDGYLVDVPFGDLELAYCMTVHKAQGSRFDTVVFVIPPIAKEFAADERMLYVGLTRGRTATWRYMVSSNQAVRCVASETAVPVSGPPS